MDSPLGFPGQPCEAREAVIAALRDLDETSPPLLALEDRRGKGEVLDG
jgi:hypothetical protein